MRPADPPSSHRDLVGLSPFSLLTVTRCRIFRLHCKTKTNTIAIDLASSHTGCAKMLRQLDLSDDKELDGVRDWKKDVDDRQSGGGKGGATESEDDLDELLGLMDFEATTTK